MFGEIKRGNQPVDAHERLAPERHAGVVQGQPIASRQLAQRAGESFKDIDSKLAAEIFAVDTAEFQLQYEFADQPLFIAQRMRAAQRKSARGNGHQVIVERRAVLVMDAGEVRKRCDANAQ